MIGHVISEKPWKWCFPIVKNLLGWRKFSIILFNKKGFVLDVWMNIVLLKQHKKQKKSCAETIGTNPFDFVKYWH